MHIVDYSHGLTGAAHDAAAFEHTAASRYPQYLLSGREFAWADSAYPLTERMIPVHKQPASNHRENAIFDRAVSHLRVHSEHCMGALKGHFQCLCGLHVAINCPDDHVRATRWMTCAIILHNLVIDVDGGVPTYFQPLCGHQDEQKDAGGEEDEEDEEDEENEGSAKRNQLIAELLAHCQALGIAL